MRILVCVKRVPLTGGTIVLAADRRGIDTAHLGFTISPHEECAVEEAVRIIESGGGEVVVLTVGPNEAEEQLRACLAMGADRAILVATDGSEWDPQSTASAIVDAVRDDEPFDLILLGNESADAANFQVGIRVAYALGLPAVCGVKKIELADGRARFERAVGNTREVYDVALPAVASVLEGLNLPRYPSVPLLLRAKSKPIDVRQPARPEQRLELLRLALPPGDGKQAEILGEGPAVASKVVELMQSLGVA
jgi:electron transfer flavoprotein beta subunit